MIYFNLVLAWWFTLGFCIKGLILDNKIRGLENQVKMRDDRVKELLDSLGKFDIC